MIIKIKKTVLDGLNRKARYADVKTDDQNGWISVERFLPADFDLVKIKLRGGKLRQGWIQNNKWAALNVRATDKVEFWKLFPKEDKDKP